MRFWSKKNIVSLPVILLIFVFFIQQYHINLYCLSPWRGGGFGMYTTFHPQNNFLKITFFLPKQQEYTITSYPGEWGEEGFRTKIFPHPRNYKALANKIKQLRWAYASFEKKEIITASASANVPESLLLQPDSIKISLLRPKPVSKNLDIIVEQLNSMTFDW